MSGDALPADFVEAWKLWPKHVRASNKRVSAQLWAKIGHQRLLDAARAYLVSPDATKADRDGRAQAFVPALEVWLRGKAEFWIEQVEERAAKASPANRSEADQVFLNGQWCWPDGTPVAKLAATIR